ncbi:MAG: YbjQ family protein [Gammaproteobacteria bacterium]
MSNLVRDIREMATNVLGGKMKRYEELVRLTVESAYSNLQEEAARQGYDAVLCVRLMSTSITQGGAEVIAYGTGANSSD